MKKLKKTIICLMLSMSTIIGNVRGDNLNNKIYIDAINNEVITIEQIQQDSNLGEVLLIIIFIIIIIIIATILYKDVEKN